LRRGFSNLYFSEEELSEIDRPALKIMSRNHRAIRIR
jgi:hypothetical protein